MPPGVPVACVGVDNAKQRGGARRAHPELVIARYTRPEIGAIWTDEARFGAMRDVEVAAAEALEDGPTPEELDAIRACDVHGRRDQRAREDPRPRHGGVRGRPGGVRRAGRAVDPLRAHVLRRRGHGAGAAAQAGGCAARARAARAGARAAEKAREHAGTLCVGRTHGVHAEPTSFGLKLAGYAMETHRNAERLERAFGQITAAISGAVGTFATLGPAYEERVARKLGLNTEPVSTQVVPRDRHAELLSAIALAGAGLERFATEIRHLQRTEVREVEEPFGKGQKGSSAMPHKRNPVVCERICGLARVLRGNAQAAWRTSRCGTSATSRTRPPSGSSCRTPRSCSTRCWR